MTTSGAGCAVCSSASHRRRLAESPTARRAVQFGTQTRRPIPKSRVSLMTVSVRSALPKLKSLLETARLVFAIQLGIHTAGEDPGGESTRCAWRKPPVRDEHHLVRPTDVEVVTDHTLEECAAGPGRSNTRVSETSKWRQASS